MLARLVVTFFIFLLLACRLSLFCKPVSADEICTPAKFFFRPLTCAFAASRKSFAAGSQLKVNWSNISLLDFSTLLLAGDIEINPGPVKYPCGSCSRPVKSNQKAVLCDSCNLWVHNTCSGLSDQMYHIFQNSSNCVWICPNCGIPSFSSSFFDSSDLTSPNSFHPLSDSETSFPVPSNNQTLTSTPSNISKRKNKAPKIKRGKCFKVLNVNINSIRGKTAEVSYLLSSEDIDIALFQETKIDDSISSSEIFPTGYDVYRNDRNLFGGGVCILTKGSTVNSNLCSDLHNDDCEAIWVKINNYNGKPLYICSFYRPPNSNAEYIQLLRSPLEKIYERHKNCTPHVIITGDFNLPDIDWSNLHHGTGNQNNLITVLDDFFLQQLVTHPTYYNSSPPHLLDLTLTTHPSLISNLNVGHAISDHCLISFNLNITCHTNTQEGKRETYLYNKGNYENIRQDIKLFGTEYLFNAEHKSVNENWLYIKSFLFNSISTNIPKKLKRNNNKRNLPWIDYNIRHNIKLRDKLSKQLKSNPTNILHDKYKKQRNKTSTLIKEKYQAFVQKSISNLTDNPRGFYKYIKSKRQENTNIPPLVFRDCFTQSPAEQAQCLNEQFCSVFSRESTNQIPFLRNMTSRMLPIEITVKGVAKLLSQLNTNKSLGPDGISPHILKQCSNELAPILANLFNQSVTSAEIPQDWLEANIFPIFKKGRKDIASNYRPVSLTSIVSKVFEHIIYSNISKHLESNNILTPKQHGFRPGFSCETQLVSAIHDWAQALDNSTETDVVIFDFSKAFDVVPHQRLLCKLNHLGIDRQLIKWISAFLTNRKQRVLINGTASTWEPVLSGVPQGTVLGPLLFLIYINDITSNIQSDIRLFADDCVLYRQINNSTDREILQKDINTLFSWSQTWKMQFNANKCFVLPITRKRRNPNNSHYIYKLGETPLQYTNSYQYLGITITTNLKWNEHINNIKNKATKTLNFLRRNIYFCTREAKSLAYLSLVRPQLEYSSAAWDPYTKSNSDLLEAVQRRAARFVTKDYSRTSSVTNLIGNLDWKLLSNRRKDNRLCLFYKAYNNLSPISLDFLQRPTRQTRSFGCSFINVQCSTDVYKYSFIPRTLVDWNALPLNARLKPNIASFKEALKQHPLG